MRPEYSFLLDREIFTDNSTIGELFDIDHATRLCYTLEDTCRKTKVYGRTAIPTGKYRVIMAEFRGMGILYPKLENVPRFEGIYIHAGNLPEDTRGCPLVGMRHGENVLYDSKKALGDVVIPKVKEYLEKGDLFISIVGGYGIEEWEDRLA